MEARGYSVSILFLLDLGSGLTVYDLSKLLGKFDRRVSNGTLIPIMNRLMDLDYVTFRKSGRKKIYSLTPGGKRYVRSVRNIREGLKRNALAGILGSNAVYLDLLASVDDMNALEQALEHIGDGLMQFLGAAFRLEKEGAGGKVAEMNTRLMRLAEDFD